MAWEIELEYVKGWLNEQDVETQLGIYAALEVLAQQGPALGRLLVDTPSHTKVKNLKELRPATSEGSEVRMLFAFDPRRKAIVLVAGDKARGGERGHLRWGGWYRKAIPLAERRYMDHLNHLGGLHES